MTAEVPGLGSQLWVKVLEQYVRNPVLLGFYLLEIKMGVARN